MGKSITTKAKRPVKKQEKSRRKGETRTSMFISDSVYEACTSISARVGLPMRQIWEAGIIAMMPKETDEIKQILSGYGIIPGWRARK